MEILSAVHNIISVNPDTIPEHLQGHQMILYGESMDNIYLVGWEDMTELVAEMIVNYLELSTAGQKMADEYITDNGKSEIVELSKTLKEIARIRREKGQFTMKTDEIRIFPCFAAHPPKAELMQRKESYYQEHGSFESEIILDGAGSLIDGYSSYLLAAKYGVSHVPVRYGRRQIIKAAHTAGGKLYAWELPGILTGRIHPGDKVTVKTSRGFRRVRVAAVEEYDGQQDALKMVVRKGRMGRR